MARISKEIECIARLEEISGGSQDMILEFLTQESLVSKEQRKAMLSSSDVAKAIHTHLASLQRDNKLQLLEYEWIVLPVERVKITIITDRNSKEFSYNF